MKGVLFQPTICQSRRRIKFKQAAITSALVSDGGDGHDDDGDGDGADDETQPAADRARSRA